MCSSLELALELVLSAGLLVVLVILIGVLELFVVSAGLLLVLVILIGVLEDLVVSAGLDEVVLEDSSTLLDQSFQPERA